MVLSEPEGLLRIAIADLETAQASSDPAVFREGAWGFWLQQAAEVMGERRISTELQQPGFDRLLHRLLLLLEAEGVSTTELQPLAQLTVYAVQFRYDDDPAPLGLDREAFNLHAKDLMARVEALVGPGSEAEA